MDISNLDGVENWDWRVSSLILSQSQFTITMEVISSGPSSYKVASYRHAMHCRMCPGYVVGLPPPFVGVTSDLRFAGRHK